MGPPPQRQIDCLYFVKKAIPETKQIKFEFSGVIDRVDEAFSTDRLFEQAGVSPTDYDIFIDPTSNCLLRHQ